MKRVYLFLFLILCVIAGSFLGRQATHQVLPAYTSTNQNAIPSAMPSTMHTIQNSTVGMPITLEIPKIHVNAQIEKVGLDAQQRMDIPKTNQDVGWYSLGFKPGDNGNAVIDGHFDTVTGAPAVFYTIPKLENGDSIIVTDTEKHKYTFLVSKKLTYQYNQVPMQKVFGPSNTPHVNLITCGGTWDKNAKNYSERTVVSADLQR